MKLRTEFITKFILLLTISFPIGAIGADATRDPWSALSTPPPAPTPQFLSKGKSEKMLSPPATDIPHDSLSIDRERMRAQAMINMIQDQELSKAMRIVTEKGMQSLNENPGIKAPIYVISAAASFWAGRTFDLIREESWKFSARLEARNRRGEFLMRSPLMNGTMRFEPSTGMNVSLNRNFDRFRADTFLHYQQQNQSLSTGFRYRLTPNLNLSVEAGRYDQNTRIEYQFNF